MSLMKRFGLIAGAAVSLSSVAMAQSTTDQSRAYANELISDSSVRTSLLAPAPAFTPKVGGYEQMRIMINSRDNSTPLDANDNKVTMGFTNARTRLNVGGNVYSEDWGYFVQFGFSDSDGTGSGNGPSSGSSGAFLEDAFITYKIGNGWDIKWGQFKLNFMQESIIGDTSQLAMERSVLEDTFSGGRVQGAEWGYTADSFRANVTLSNGFRTANTDYNSGTLAEATPGGEADFSITGRFDFKWAGDWKQANDFTSWQNSQFFGMVGGAIHYQSGGSTAYTYDDSLVAFTVDCMVKGNGWNAFASFVYAHDDPNLPAGSNSSDNYGLLVQGGIFVAAQWELFGRYDAVFFDSNLAPNDDTFNTVTAGVNYYIVPDSQAIKFTAELEYFIDNFDTSSVPSNTLTGVLGPSSDAQFLIGAQLQIAF